MSTDESTSNAEPTTSQAQASETSSNTVSQPPTEASAESAAPEEAAQADPSAANPEAKVAEDKANVDANDDEKPSEEADATPEGESAQASQSATDEQAQRIAELTTEAKGYKERMMRIAADFENFRKRSVRELKDARDRGRQSAIESLLPVFDNVERATGIATDQTDAKGMADGLRMIHKQFNDALGKLGIERVDALEQPFDPMVHEAIQYMYSDKVAAGLVSQQLQPGYKQGDRLMRPAMVVVSKGPQPAAEKPAAENASEDSTAAVSEASSEAETAGVETGSSQADSTANDAAAD